MTSAVASAASSIGCAAPATAGMRACPVCGARGGRSLHRQRYALFDDSALPHETTLVECDDCGLVRAASDATVDSYRRHYAQHSKYDTAVAASGSGESACDAARLDALVRHLAARFAPSLDVLDIGAGRGGLLAAFRRHGFEQLSGMDPSAGCVAAMRAAGFVAEVGTLEAGRWASDPRHFDLVVLSHVLEHVFDVSAAFASAARRVVDDGAIYVEVPDASRYTVDGFPPFYFFDPEHINHFDLPALTQLATRAGWVVRSAWSRVLDLDGGQPYPAIGVILERGATTSLRVDGTAVRSVANYVARSTAAARERVDTRTLETLAAERTPVVVWGAGSHAQRLLALGALGRCAIDCIIDADPGKQGRRLAGHAVVAPEAGLARAVALGATLVVAIAVGGDAVVDRLHRTMSAERVVRP